MPLPYTSRTEQVIYALLSLLLFAHYFQLQLGVMYKAILSNQLKEGDTMDPKVIGV